MKKLIGNKEIQLTEKYLKKFKVMPLTGTLFEPEWWRAKQGVCPLCLCKLRKMLKRKGYICTSPKHAKPFVYTGIVTPQD